MDWVERVKYLGCYFRSRTGEVDTAYAVGKFYSSLNNILNVLGKQRNEMLAVHITYGENLLYSDATVRL